MKKKPVGLKNPPCIRISRFFGRLQSAPYFLCTSLDGRDRVWQRPEASQATWSLIPKFALRILSLMMVLSVVQYSFFLRQKYQKNITNWFILRIETIDLDIKNFGTSQKFRRIAISSVIRNTSSRKLEDVHPNLGAKKCLGDEHQGKFLRSCLIHQCETPKRELLQFHMEYLMRLPICIIKKLQQCLFL